MTKKQWERRANLMRRLSELGFTEEEVTTLRRIERILQAWGEAECGDSNDYASFSIERDEMGKPFRVFMPHCLPPSQATRTPIPDREAGALVRLNKIVAARNARHTDVVVPYHQ